MTPAQAALSRTRKLLVQALYQAQLTSVPAAEVAAPFIEQHNMKRADPAYFTTVMQGITAELDCLEAAIKPHLDREMSALDPISRGILLLGAYELARQPEVPAKVAITEALELAKTFGPEESHRFVNAIMDKLARQQRPKEFK